MGRQRALRLAPLLLLLFLVLPPVAAPEGERDPGAAAEPAKRRFAPVRIAQENLSPPEGRGYMTAWLERKVAMRNKPGGKVVARLKTRTEWGTPRIFNVVDWKGRWLGVSTDKRPNGKLGWIPITAVRLTRVTDKLVADLSERKLTLYRNGRALKRIPVAVGRSANPTPTGRFAITDLLLVQTASPYGCCVIALSGRQPIVPANWPGGDRLAIHATTNPGSIGRAASIGCLRASERHMRWLIKQALQPGTPVFIKR